MWCISMQKVEWKETEKKDYILYFGRFSEEKGIGTLIKVCKELPDVQFIFAGTGPLEETVNGIKNIKNVGFQKGSKNKPKTVTADFATQIAEKQSAKEALTAEIASITANIDTLKADLKEKKTALKKAEKEVATLEAKKAKADAKAAEEAKKAEAESVLKKLLAEGMSADEILAKLK